MAAEAFGTFFAITDGAEPEATAHADGKKVFRINSRTKAGYMLEVEEGLNSGVTIAVELGQFVAGYVRMSDEQAHALAAWLADWSKDNGKGKRKGGRRG